MMVFAVRPLLALALGHKFRTGTDTEVVLHACQQWGTGVAERLNGMYGFAVWDVPRHQLLLVREPVGRQTPVLRPSRRGRPVRLRTQGAVRQRAGHPGRRRGRDAGLPRLGPHTDDLPATIGHVRDLLGDIADRHVRGRRPARRVAVRRSGLQRAGRAGTACHSGRPAYLLGGLRREHRPVRSRRAPRDS